jgi:hypothetical protein
MKKSRKPRTFKRPNLGDPRPHLEIFLEVYANLVRVITLEEVRVGLRPAETEKLCNPPETHGKR